MEYEKSLGVFSPDGRLIQLERAHECSSHSPLLVFTKTADSVLIFSENRKSAFLPTQKIFLVCPILKIYMSYSGLSSDFHKILYEARLIVRSYKLQYGEDLSICVLAKMMAKFYHKYTISGSYRPLGVRVVLFDRAQIYCCEPDGNYVDCNKGAFGQRCGFVNEMFDKDADGFEALYEITQNDAKKVVCYEIKDDVSVVSEQKVKEVFDEIERTKKDATK